MRLAERDDEDASPHARSASARRIVELEPEGEGLLQDADPDVGRQPRLTRDRRRVEGTREAVHFPHRPERRVDVAVDLVLAHGAPHEGVPLELGDLSVVADTRRDGAHVGHEGVELGHGRRALLVRAEVDAFVPEDHPDELVELVLDDDDAVALTVDLDVECRDTELALECTRDRFECELHCFCLCLLAALPPRGCVASLG